MNMLGQSMVNMQIVVNNLYERIDIATDIKYETANMDKVFRKIMDHQVNESDTTFTNAWEESNLKIRQEIESLKEMDKQEKSHELMEKYTALQDSYQNLVQQVITMQGIDRKVDTQP